MKNITLKALLGITTSFFAFSINAQCPSISCPSDITVNNDAGTCGAVVEYTTPFGIDPCGSQSYDFTNCGVTGRLGPTQTEVNSEYTGSLSGQVTINTQGVQEWTVPTTGSYTIEVAGAKGGDANASITGGLGASMQGVFLLTSGDQLKIIVGQRGENASYAGGGGASAVSLNNSPLIVAGGGGGANSVTNPNNGYDAVTGTDGVASYTPGGTGGNGSDGGKAQGGAGYLTDGQNIGLSGTSGPQALQNGGAGGLGYSQNYWGGFGGGGSGFGGGGGGGYSGGSGGDYTCCTSVEASGGGGGSFNSGTNQVNQAGANNNHGYVTITYNGSVTTTQTAGLTSGSSFPVGTTTNTFEVDDGNGNIETCSFDVVVEDVELPVPDATTLPTLVAECKINSLDQATATDNCDGVIYGTHNMTYPITTDTIMTWTFEDVAGNVTTQTQEIVLSGLNVNVSVNDPMLVANNSDTGITYQWINCETGASIDGATGQSFIPESNGSYAVVLTLGSCINVSQCYTVSTVSLNEHSIEGMELYPNPNDGLFTVNSGTTVNHYTVVDGSGRLIQEGAPKSTSFEVSLKTYDAGMYYLHVNDEVLKVVVR